MSGLRRCTSCDVVMGASASRCPICASPAAVAGPTDDDLVVVAGSRDEDGAVEDAAVEDGAVEPALDQHDAVPSDEDLDVIIDLTQDADEATADSDADDTSSTRELVGSSTTRRGGAERQAVPDDPRHTARGRTRPKTPLRPYVPPEQVDEPAAATPDAVEAVDDEVRSAAPPAVAPPPPPPVTDTFLSDHPDGLDGARPSSPWAPPEAGATPDPTADTPPSPAAEDADEPRPKDPRRRTARVLLVLLVAMVGVGLWLQWDRIGELFDGNEESSPVEVTDVGPDHDEARAGQAPVVEGRLERNVGSFVTHVTLESITT